MNLDLLRIYVKVAALSSFTAAADQLGLPKARASTAVQRLEADIGVRLLHRTTRTVRMTPDGEQFLERAEALLAEAEELQTLFQKAPTSLRGRLRVDLPTGFARHVVIPRLPEFLAAHPLLDIELSSTDRRVDLVHEGFDCVLRIGQLHDSGLVARRLGKLPLVNFASPAYLKRHGVPHTLDDLRSHRLVRYVQTLGTTPSGWEYHDGERYRTFDMPGVITVTHTDAYEAACMAGLGMIQAPAIGLRQVVEAGQLVEVMPGFTGEPMPVSLVYASRRNMPKRVQAFMDWLAGVTTAFLH